MSEQPSEAVRTYLQFLEDPSSLRNEQAIADAEAAVAAAPDPLAKLLAISKLERARNVDGESYRNAFIAHAATFAKEQKVHSSAWITMGVPKADLAAAGLLPTAASGGASGRKTGRTRVTQEQVADTARSMGRSFSISALAEAAGTTLQTATKTIRAMEESGDVVCVGPDANHSSRGRAPMLYRVK